MKVRAWLSVGMMSSTLLLVGCSQFNKVFDNDDEDDYKRSDSVQSLDLPPDLTAPKYDATFTINDSGTPISAQTASAAGGVEVLPESVDMAFKGQGEKRYLEVSLLPGLLWQKIQAFWESTDVKLRRNEAEIGIMETEWIEKRGTLPKGLIQKLLGSVLKNINDTGIRDRYTLRLERVKGDKTNIYMTHRGSEQVVEEFGSSWQMRPANPEKAAEMLNRLHTYLQKNAKKAKVIVAPKPKQPAVNKVAIVKPSVVSTTPKPQFSTPKTIEPLAIKPRLNQSVSLSTVGTLGADVVNLPEKKTRPVVQPRQVKVVNKQPVAVAKPVISQPNVAVSKKSANLAFLSTTNDGQPALGVRKSYTKTLVQMDAVLKQAGFSIDGKNAKNGLYAIQYKGSKGKKDIIKKGSKQILHVIKIGKVSAMRLLDINGQPLNAAKAKKILGGLESAFNRS